MLLLLCCAFFNLQGPKLPQHQWIRGGELHTAEAWLPAGWQEQNGAVVGEPHAVPLATPYSLGTGSFHVEIQLAWTKGGHSAASLQIDDSHLGLSGEGNHLFLEGPLFGGSTRILTDIAPPAVDTLHTLRVDRSAGTLRFSLDDQQVAEVPDPGSDFGRLALRPHRDRLRVVSWVHHGETTPLSTPMPLTTVWRSGEDGYHTYRIPSLVRAADGSLVAVAEGRRGGTGDSGDIDLVVKRSPDNGASWTAQQVIWDDGPNTCGNPCLVLDQSTGVLWLLATHNLGEDHEAAIIAGRSRGTRTVWVMRSEDHGGHWSPPHEITATVKDPSWTWYATGPGAGIQLRTSGRLVIPCDHIEGGSKGYFSHVIWSDDHGRSWQRGGSSPQDQVNECEVAELEDGRLLLNMRNYQRSARSRQIAWSDDAGAHWYGQRHDSMLIEPICQASLRRWRWAGDDGPGVLLFSNPASTHGRQSLTLRASWDDGLSWPWRQVIHHDGSAYSCLATAPDAIWCLFEADGYRRIALARWQGGELPSFPRPRR